MRITPPDGLDVDRLMTLMARDKKALDGLTFVLDGPAGVEVVADVPEHSGTVALESLREVHVIDPNADRHTPIDHARRVSMVQSRLPADNGCDALLFTDLVDVRWLSGFTGSNGWAVVTADDLIVGTDGRYGDRARAETASSGATVIAETSRVQLHARLVESLVAARSVGLDPASTSHSEWGGSPTTSPCNRWTRW